MNSKVIVTADATTNAVINPSNNPDYGYIRVQQVRTMIDDNGFLRRKLVSAIVPSTMAELLESGFYNGQQLDGKIVIEESLEPFNAKTPERDLKIAGDTGIVCTVGGQPIYRKTKYTLDNFASDVLVKHDNVEELRAAYANAAKANTAGIRNAAGQDFNI